MVLKTVETNLGCELSGIFFIFTNIFLILTWGRIPRGKKIKIKLKTSIWNKQFCTKFFFPQGMRPMWKKIKRIYRLISWRLQLFKMTVLTSACVIVIDSTVVLWKFLIIQGKKNYFLSIWTDMIKNFTLD